MLQRLVRCGRVGGVGEQVVLGAMEIQSNVFNSLPPTISPRTGPPSDSLLAHTHTNARQTREAQVHNDRLPHSPYDAMQHGKFSLLRLSSSVVASYILPSPLALD
jgi:hypothetical protein